MISSRVAEIVAQRGDPPVADADVAGEGVGGGRNRAAADDGVEIHALFPLTPFLRGVREYATVTAARWSRPVGRGSGGACLGLSVTRSAILGGSLAANLLVLPFGLSAAFSATTLVLPLPPSQLGQQPSAFGLERRREPSRLGLGRGPCRGGARGFDDFGDRRFELDRDLGGFGIARQVGDALAWILPGQRDRQVDFVLLGPALRFLAGDDLHILPGLLRQPAAPRQPVGHAAGAGIIGGGCQPEIAEILHMLLQEARRNAAAPPADRTDCAGRVRRRLRA